MCRSSGGYAGSSRLTTWIPALAALPNSSCASSIDRPFASDCAAPAGNPDASSSVKDALNTPSTPPKNSTSRLARVGPKPVVKVKASHNVRFGRFEAEARSVDSETATLGKKPPQQSCRLYAARKMRVKVTRHMFDKIFGSREL